MTLFPACQRTCPQDSLVLTLLCNICVCTFFTLALDNAANDLTDGGFN